MEQRVLMSSRGISRHRKTNKVHKNHVNIDVFVEKDKNDKEGMGDIEPMEPKERVHQKANLEGNLQHLDNVNEKEAMMKDKQVVGARGKGRDIICKVSQTTRPWVFLEEPFAVEEKPPKYENNSKHKKIIEEDLKGMKGDKKLDHHHQAIEAKGDPILDIFGNENTDKDQTFQDQGQQQEQLDGEQIVQVQKKKKKKGIQKERQNRHQHNLQHQQGQDRLDPVHNQYIKKYGQENPAPPPLLFKMALLPPPLRQVFSKVLRMTRLQSRTRTITPPTTTIPKLSAGCRSSSSNVKRKTA